MVGECHVTTTADLPNDRYVIAALDHITSAAVPHDDPLAPLARRWLNGKRQDGDEAELQAWLGDHPQYEITRLPPDGEVPPVSSLPLERQLTLWTAA